jgi:hypothetical protein
MPGRLACAYRPDDNNFRLDTQKIFKFWDGNRRRQTHPIGALLNCVGNIFVINNGSFTVSLKPFGIARGRSRGGAQQFIPN